MTSGTGLVLAILGVIGMAGCVSSGPGRLRVIVRSEIGEEIPGVAVTAGRHVTTSKRHVGAEFENLERANLLVDVRAQVPGMRSCGPITARVRRGRETVVTLVMRMAAIRDYVQFVGLGAPDPDQQLVSELVFRACAGRPESAFVVRTFASGRTQESRFWNSHE